MNGVPPEGPARLSLISSEEPNAGPDRGQVNPPGTGTLGIYILVASLSVLFVASMLGYFYIRFSAPQWPPPGMPGLPSGLWLSTILLIGCSVAIHRALLAVRRDDQRGLRRGIIWTFVLGSLFLVLQVLNYIGLAQSNLTATTNLYGFTFYMMTALHAAHVIGGLIPLAVVLRRAVLGRYTSFVHSGVEYVSIYWHFLDVVWVVIFFVLLFGS